MAKGMRARFSLALAAASALAAVLPAAASAGIVAGTVSEAGGAHAALEGVEVCSHRNPYNVEDVCAATDSGGHYALSVGAGSYSIHFSDQPRNRNLVNQYFGGTVIAPGTYVTLANGDETVTGVDAQLVAGSTIAGTVTDAASGAPLAEIPVCADALLPGGTYYERCARSGPGGTYAINGLAAGRYEVGFQSGLLNYQPQRYDGTVWPQPWTPVDIAEPGEVKNGIDAAMKVGVEITGRLTEAGSGDPLAGISVELLVVGREGNGLARTGPNGEFRFWGRGEGDYALLFSKPEGPFGTDGDCFAAQYYKGSSTLAGATVLHGVPGVPVTGVDDELFRTCPKPGPQPLQVTVAPATTQVGVGTKPARCPKGFHRRRVKGKARCVRRHQRHHRHRHQRG